MTDPAVLAEIAALKARIGDLEAARQSEPRFDPGDDLFDALWGVGGGDQRAVFRTREVMKLAALDPALMRLIVAVVGDSGSLPIRLGRWLQRIAGHDFAGRTVKRLDADDGGVGLWQFVGFGGVAGNSPLGGGDHSTEPG